MFRLSGQVFQAFDDKSDLGCGAGGGRNNADVFHLAGLTFLTNANADDSQYRGETLSIFITDTYPPDLTPIPLPKPGNGRVSPKGVSLCACTREGGDKQIPRAR